MDPIKNPTPRRAPNPALTGRDAQIASFKILVERLRIGRSEKSLMVIGLRGVGKTVLLNKFRIWRKARAFEPGRPRSRTEPISREPSRLARRIILSLT